MELSNRQKRFLEFVKEQHGEQKRKYTGEPYWHHVYAVAEIVAPYEPSVIEIALGHDMLEDTPCTYDDLLFFLKNNGYEEQEATFIANGVQELTDEYERAKYPDKNRRERKRLEAGSHHPGLRGGGHRDVGYRRQGLRPTLVPYLGRLHRPGALLRHLRLLP